MKKKNGLPARWLAYKNVGERIAGTPFVAFKVPLGENFFTRMRPSDRFTPDELISANPDIKLIIDLTNTQRYYSVESVERRGVKYCKLSCPGRMVPTERLIRRFCEIVFDFLTNHSNNDEDTVIGVHCTHGVNRTGFMVCSFMIRHMLMDPREAITVFETARGHTIERQEYVEALMRQYARNVALRKPRTPPRGIPPVLNIGDSEDGGLPTPQRYGFGVLNLPSTSSSSWAPLNPRAVSWGSKDQDNSWRSTGSGPQHIRWGHALVTEAGTSQMGVPNEPSFNSQGAGDRSSSGGNSGIGSGVASSSGGGNGGREGGNGSRKWKKDKRHRKRRRPSPDAEGEDSNNRTRNTRDAIPEGAHLQRSPSASQDHDKETREDPACDGRARMKTEQRPSSHLAPHQPRDQSLPQLPFQYQRHPRPRPQPRHDSPHVPSPFPSSAERGFGYGVERERGPGAGPATSQGGGGGGGRGRGGDGRGWGRARWDGRARGSWERRASGRDRPYDQHGHGRGGHGHARARGGGGGGDGYEPGRGRGRAGRPWNRNQHHSNAPTGAE